MPGGLHPSRPRAPLTQQLREEGNEMDRILRSTAAKIAVAIAASALAVLVASSGIIMAVLWNEGFLRGSADDVRRNMAERLLQRDANHAYEETLGASDMYEIYDSETSPSFDSDEAMAESAAKEAFTAA